MSICEKAKIDPLYEESLPATNGLTFAPAGFAQQGQTCFSNISNGTVPLRQRSQGFNYDRSRWEQNPSLTFASLEYAAHNKDTPMSHNLENNKIFAAVLVAGIVAMLCGFAASILVSGGEHHGDEEKLAIEIDTSALEAAASGSGAPVGPDPILALLAGADIARGEALAKACLACHGFDKGGANKVGPNLYGVVNNIKGHAEGFAYSAGVIAMKEAGEKWTYQNLNKFLWKPAAYIKGTKMSFPGLKKPQDRADVIAYMRTQADSAAALPSEADIAAERSSSEAIAQKEAPKEEPKVEEPAPAAEEKSATASSKTDASPKPETVDAPTPVPVKTP
jgi:cytochrome c